MKRIHFVSQIFLFSLILFRAEAFSFSSPCTSFVHHHSHKSKHSSPFCRTTPSHLILQNSHSNNPHNISNDGNFQSSSASTTATTAPEVNQWTTLMADGTNAVINHPNPINQDPDELQESLQKLYQDLDDMTQYDEDQVEQYWDMLLPKVSYLGTTNVVRIKKALRVAYRAHRGQFRKSGEPFIIHPVEVSSLLSDLKMDTETIISGVLHDTVEDTNITFAQVEALFGPIVRSIVEGETKVSKLPKLGFSDYADEQAENLRQMFVAMSDDYRIIIVKLADRLHNMRTLRHMKPEKQLKISRETLDIFAPLAHRMGIWQFKSELEDTAFMYLYPNEYQYLYERLHQHTAQFRETLEHTQHLLLKTLREDPTLRDQQAHVEVDGRTKDLYSLWLKMESKSDHNFDHIADVVALRVILYPKVKEETEVEDVNGGSTYNYVNGVNGRVENEVNGYNNVNGFNDESNKNGFPSQRQNDGDVKRDVWLCYHALGLVQHLPGYQPVPTRVKDYISFPKPNGYQALHTELMLNGQTIEVQIRTAAMHQVAEKGMAAHWAYTDEKKRKLSLSSSNNALTYNTNQLYNTPWLSSIKEWQDDETEVVNSRDFVECVRRELLGKRVFVFLRNGKILNLARGATVIDAAFQIHTEVGLTMHGVHVNGKHVPFSYELQNGDVVSILTGENGKPELEWMRYAKSRSTRSKLRSYFRGKQRESLKEAGRILLLDFLSRHQDIIIQHSFIESDVPTSLEDISEFLSTSDSISAISSRYQDLDELLVAIGRRHDWDFLRSVVSKLLMVPLSILVEADKDQSRALSKSVYAAVFQKRQLAHNAGKAFQTDNDDSSTSSPVVDNDIEEMESSQHGYVEQIPSTSTMLDVLNQNGSFEEADFEHLCPHCLPVIGDEIVGTRPLHSKDSDIPATVHRSACKHAMRAINKTRALVNDGGLSLGAQSQSNPISTTDYSDANDDDEDMPVEYQVHKARTEMKRSFSNSGIRGNNNPDEIAVNLRWPEVLDVEFEDQFFVTEVVVTSNDRKQLLSDCGEIVSQIADIVKTASITVDNVATFEYVVRVTSTSHLQELMDALSALDSVMSVERRFGSKLL